MDAAFSAGGGEGPEAVTLVERSADDDRPAVIEDRIGQQRVDRRGDARLRLGDKGDSHRFRRGHRKESRNGENGDCPH